MFRAPEGIIMKQKGKSKQQDKILSRIDSKHICDFNLISLFIHLLFELELHYATLGVLQITM